jgi:predicted O-methyltransferase YrrM
MDLTQYPSHDPLQLYRYRDGLYAVDLIAAAVVHLDLFNWLEARGSATLDEICAHFGFHERPVDVLMSLLRCNGLVEGGFSVTDKAREFLLAESQWDVTPYYASMKDRPVCLDFVKVLRTGKPANWASDENLDDWHEAMETEDFARSFTAAMDCRGALLGHKLAMDIADELAGRSNVLDIGGGSGIYACALVANHAHLRATVLEKPPVDAVAREYIERRGFAGRIDVVAGEMFTDAYPPVCDVHLFSNVLHDWDKPEVRKLLAQSHATLPRGGLLVVHEAFLNDDKSGPLPVAEYSAVLVSVTQGKCYSTGEMRELFEEAGFEWIRHRDTVIDRGYILGRKL